MSMTIDFVPHDGDTGLTICCTIERVSDGYYWDTSDSTFKARASITPGDEQVTLTEDADEAGRYMVTQATVNPLYWADGRYNIIIRDYNSNVLLCIQQKYLKDQSECILVLSSLP